MSRATRTILFVVQIAVGLTLIGVGLAHMFLHRSEIRIVNWDWVAALTAGLLVLFYRNAIGGLKALADLLRAARGGNQP